MNNQWARLNSDKQSDLHLKKSECHIKFTAESTFRHFKYTLLKKKRRSVEREISKKQLKRDQGGGSLKEILWKRGRPCNTVNSRQWYKYWVKWIAVSMSQRLGKNYTNWHQI